MYIGGLIPRDSTELAEAVPIEIRSDMNFVKAKVIIIVKYWHHSSGILMHFVL